MLSWPIRYVALVATVALLGQGQHTNEIKLGAHQQPGLFFEGIGTMQTQTDTWRIAIIIKTREMERRLEKALSYIVNASGFMSCKARCKGSRTNAVTRRAQIVYDRFAIQLGAIAAYNISRRDAREIDSLAKILSTEHTMVTDVRKKLTVTQSTLAFSPEKADDWEWMYNYTTALRNKALPDENGTLYEHEYIYLIYYVAMDNITNALTVDSRKVRKSLREIDGETVPEAILPFERLREILDTINSAIKQKGQIPISANTINPNNVKELINVQVGRWERNILVTIDVPIVATSELQVYKTRPIPIAQTFSDYTSAATIRPSIQFILTDGSTFEQVLEDRLTECRRINNKYVCDKRSVKTINNNTCELLILRNKMETNIRKCDIRYSNTFKPTIEKLTKENRWVISTNQKSKINISCNGGVEEINLNGVSVLTLDDYCETEYEGRTIANEYEDPSHQNKILVIPNGTLQVEKIIKDFNEIQHVFEKLAQNASEDSLWDLEKRSRREATARREARRAMLLYVLIGTATAAVLLLGAILTFLYKLKKAFDETPGVVEVELSELGLERVPITSIDRRRARLQFIE